MKIRLALYDIIMSKRNSNHLACGRLFLFYMRIYKEKTQKSNVVFELYHIAYD